MRIPFVIIAASSLIALGGIANADDHLFQAELHGLANNPNSQGIIHGDKAPGQGSPFAGEETHTPSSLVVSGDEENGIDPKPHANIKERTPK
jgi:hypothetical protein